MNSSTRRLARVSAAISLAAMVGLGAAVPTFAIDAQPSVNVIAGNLGGGAITYADFLHAGGGDITLNGLPQTATATWAIANVTDYRGSTAGWNLSLTATPFAEYTATGGGVAPAVPGYLTGGHTLAASSLKITTASTVGQADSTSDAANTITPAPVTTALDTGGGVKLLSAAANGGKGGFTVTSMTSTLAVPANAYAATYKSDATVSLTTTP